MSVTAMLGRLTADEYLDRSDLPLHSQLVEGEVVVNSPSWLHQQVQLRIVFALQSWIAAGSGRGAVNLPVDVRIDDRNVYAPDVVWFAEERRPAITSKWVQPPDLAVEIRSESAWIHDVGIKKDRYATAGVQELWLVDTESHTVLVYRASDDPSGWDDVIEVADALTSPLLPGFTLEIPALFTD